MAIVLNVTIERKTEVMGMFSNEDEANGWMQAFSEVMNRHGIEPRFLLEHFDEQTPDPRQAARNWLKFLQES